MPASPDSGLPPQVGAIDIVDEPQLSAGDLIRDWMRVIYRYRWLSAAVLALVVLGGAAYTFTRIPEFEAQAQLLIETEDPRIVSFQEVVGQGRSEPNYYQTQYELLRSRSLAARTMASLKLWGVKSSGEDGRPESPEETAPINAYQSRLRVLPVRSTRLVNIRFRSTDPTQASAVVNEHARQYLEQNLAFRARASEEATEWLNERLQQERRRVEESEAALHRYRELNDAVSLEDGQNIVVQKLADLNAAVTRGKTKRLETEARYRQLLGLQADRLDSFPAIFGNEMVQRLKLELASVQRERAELAQTLGDRHPRLVEKVTAIRTIEQRLQAEVGKIVQSLRTEYESALAEETSLTRALEEQKAAALAHNRRGIEYGVLKREAESVRHVYDGLLQRAKEIGVASQLRVSNIRIVDYAQPPLGPSWPRPVLNMIATSFAGVLLALGCVFLLELLDERVKTPADVTKHLGLRLIGLIPRVRGRTASGDLSDVTSALEAFRGVRSILLHESDPPARSILVTSTARGEGKTVVATNLAIALAKVHRRVLLIDADTRDPEVHSLFGEQREPGLTTFLDGNATVDAVLKQTAVPGLDLTTAGAVPSDPAELLGSSAFRKFLEIARNRYDYIVIDTPPVMAVADAVVASHEAESIVFVVRADTTSRRSARLALEQLRGAKAFVLGAVLNDADLRHNPYYYSPYYRPEYGGYGAHEASRRRGLSITHP